MQIKILLSFFASFLAEIFGDVQNGFYIYCRKNVNE